MFTRTHSPLLAVLPTLLLCWAAHAQKDELEVPEPPDFTPNKTISEQIIAFGSDPVSAERAAMITSWEIARDGVFKVKNIGFGRAGSDEYCLLSIQHEVYDPPDSKRVDEMVVGFAASPRSALETARSKARARIRDNPSARPNLRRSTLPGDLREIMPMPKEQERDFIAKSIRFQGRGDDWRCYLKFEYLEVK
ncbi:MAG: hypothetical protein ACLFSZ_02470 [Puniceicoccaceae bacterium]